MDKRKILYIAQEFTPYLPETPLSKRSRCVAQTAAEKGFEVRTFMPKYGSINERRNQLHEVIRLSGINLIIDDTDHPLIIKVATLPPTRMQVYFIDNDDYFRHGGLSKELETKTMTEDNDERIIFFVRGVVETVKKLKWAPEVIHCSGWIAALAPLYLKTRYSDDPSFRDSKIVFSITEAEEMPSALGERFIEKLKLENFTPDELAPLGDGPVGFDELMNLAIAYSDAFIEDTETNPALHASMEATGRPLLAYNPEADDARLAEDTLALYEQIKDQPVYHPVAIKKQAARKRPAKQQEPK